MKHVDIKKYLEANLDSTLDILEDALMGYISTFSNEETIPKAEILLELIRTAQTLPKE